MRFFRKLLTFLLTIAIVGGAGFIISRKFRPQLRNYILIEKPCSRPLDYSIGSVDPQFNINKENVASLAQKAEDIWEKQAGKDLFSYNPEAQLKINLVFDDRQKQALEAVDLEQKLSKLKISDANLKSQYEKLYAQYSAKIDSYNALAQKYAKSLAAYNKEVNFWNKKGGAPSAEYEKLKSDQNDLEDMIKDLEKKRKEINNLTSRINSLVSQEKKIIGSYNQSVATYRSKYGGSREFEKGVFNGQEINIYQFNENSDLEMTISHELGHALGIGHVENPESIMYYLIGEQDLDNPVLTSEDLVALKNICQIN